MKNQIKSFCVILALTLLFQSCKVYQQNSITLEEASKESLPVKVETKKGEALKYMSIINEGNEFFGLKKKKGNIIKFPINGQDLKSLRLMNKKKSTAFTGLMFLGVLTTGVIVYDSYCCFSFGPGY